MRATRKTRSVNLVILFLPGPSVSKSLKKQVASVIESANNARAYDAQRTLSWVHLASRYPVRVRVKGPPADLFRVGESAVVIIRGR
jgi:multidrug resistance efflux pump